MSQDSRTETEDEVCASGRQKGKGRLKRCNMAMLMLSVVILMVLCGLLLSRIYSLNGTVEGLRTQAERMGQVIEGQREQLAQMELLES